MFEMKIRYAVVFKVDGLDLDGLKNTLLKYGEITEILDDMLGDEPVKIVIISSDFSKAVRLKLDFNCVEAEDNSYVLFPMESLDEKLKVLKERKGA